MAKKTKTTLKDVSDFLQKKPSTLVQVKKPVHGTNPDNTAVLPDSDEELIALVKTYVESRDTDRTSLLLELIEESLSGLDDDTLSVEEIMLLNTVAYLKLKI